MSALKENLYQQCVVLVAERLQRIQQTIADQREALSSETKSSAGDKHETGRAMLHLEREKTGKQLAAVQQLQHILAKINPTHQTTKVALGSLVYTTQDVYFISISLGQLTCENTVYFAIAANTPIGKGLLGKSKGDTFVFRGKTMEILDVQ